VNITLSTVRAAVGVQQPFELIKSRNGEVAVKRVGRGCPVLCLTAIGHGGRDYEAFAQRVIPHGFEVVTLDWPGHGASPSLASGAEVSARNYAALVSDIIPQIWPDGPAPILIGNSVGGATALLVALQQPQLVRALVISNAGGLARPDRISAFVVRRMIAFMDAGVRSKSWFPLAFRLYYRLVLPQPAAQSQRERIIRAAPELAPLLKQAWTSFLGSGADLRGLIPSLNVPVLWAWAKDDRIVAWSRSRDAALLAPKHEITLFPGGHSPFLEVPDGFASRFLAFAATLGPTEMGDGRAHLLSSD
jgi:4,5:9,10-diseco-3-hydroxy-5,9,17-trioxoandrosta-1(10),2-diene-4-oate hydrolase